MFKTENVISFMGTTSVPLGLFKTDTFRSNNVIGKRLQDIRKRLGINQAVLCDYLSTYGIDVGVSAISRWEKGITVPDAYQLLALCCIFRIDDVPDAFADLNKKRSTESRGLYNSLLDLPEYDRDIFHTAVDAVLEKHRQEFVGKTLNRFVRRRCMEDLICAGDGTNMEDDGDFEYIYLATTPEVEQSDRVFTITGDSMEPKYHSGQKVLVSDCSQPQPGKEYVFSVPGIGGVIKRYEPDGLHPLNPDFDVMYFKDCMEADERPILVGQVIGAVDENLLPTEEEQAILDENYPRHR